MMRRLLCLLGLLAYSAGAQPETPYQPLAFLAGRCWQGFLADGKQTDRHCFRWIYDGKFLRDEHVVHDPGKADYRGETLYFWDPSKQQVQYLYIENQGSFSLGTMSTDKNDLVFAPTSHVASGATQIYRSRWQRSGDNAYEVITEFQSKDGWVPRLRMHMQAITEK